VESRRVNDVRQFQSNADAIVPRDIFGRAVSGDLPDSTLVLVWARCRETLLHARCPPGSSIEHSVMLRAGGAGSAVEECDDLG
jgi:hypothetical protein